MRDEIQIVNPSEFENWDELLLRSGDNSVFHSAAWARVLEESYDYTPKYFCHKDGSSILALIPLMEINSSLTGKRGVALPFTDFCSPFITEPKQLDDIISAIFEYGWRSDWKYIELRGDYYYDENVPFSSFYYGHTLKLEANSGNMFANFRNNNKRNIKKAVKNGVRIEFGITAEDLNNFYWLNCKTRKRHGLPPQPIKFFRNLKTYILDKDYGRIGSAMIDNKTIASAIFINFGNKVVYKYGASDYAYQSLRPNNLLMWEAIKAYGEKGFQEFSFGRTEHENEGLRQFKNSWNPTENVIKYYRYNTNSDKFIEKARDINGKIETVFRLMPDIALKFIGKVLYRHMG
jgi:hypothetical protein